MVVCPECHGRECNRHAGICITHQFINYLGLPHQHNVLEIKIATCVHEMAVIGRYLPCKFLGSGVVFSNSKSFEVFHEELRPTDSVENVISIDIVQLLRYYPDQCTS